MRGLGADQDIHQPVVEPAGAAEGGDRPVGIEDDTILKQPGGELDAEVPWPALRLDGSAVPRASGSHRPAIGL